MKIKIIIIIMLHLIELSLQLHRFCYAKDTACTRDLLNCLQCLLPSTCPLASYPNFDTDPGVYVYGTCLSYSCSSVNYYSLVAFTFIQQSSRDSGMVTITSMYTQVMTYTPVYTPTRCPHIDCRVLYSSGVDHSSCITVVNAKVGAFTLNTNGCTNFGKGYYKYGCRTSSNYVETASSNIVIEILDYCHGKNVQQPLAYAGLLYEQHSNSNQQVVTHPLSTFISIIDPTKCGMTTCQVVQTISSLCSTTPATFITGVFNGINVKLTIGTATPQPKLQYCVQCSTNDVTPLYVYSKPFDVEVTNINCTNKIIITPFATTVFSKLVVQSTPFIRKNFIIGNSWISTEFGCPFTLQLKNINTSVYSGTWIQTDSSGTISYGHAAIESQTLQVQVTSVNGYLMNSGQFQITQSCRPLVLNSVPTANVFYLSANPPQLAQDIFDIEISLNNGWSHVSICSRTYSLHETNTLGYSGPSILAISGSKVQVDVNSLKASMSVLVRVVNVADSASQFSNQFQVQVICNPSGYSIAPHASLTNLVTWNILTNLPVFQLNQFTYLQNQCKATLYKILTAKVAGLSPPTDMTPGQVNAVTTPNALFHSTQVQVVATYNFYIEVTLEGGQKVWASVGGNELFQLKVVCGPLSTVLSLGVFPTGLAKSQTVILNLNQGFTLPLINLSRGSVCPITVQNYLVPTTSLQTPFETSPGSGSYIVRPTNDALDQVFHFQVKFIADGGASLTLPLYTHIHGCLVQAVQYIQPLNFVKFLVVGISNSIVDKYKIEANISPIHCKLLSFEVVNLKYNGVSSTVGIQPAQSCKSIQPCQLLDLFKNDHQYTLSFRIKVTMTNNNIAYSDYVLIQMKCTSTSATLTSTVTQAVKYDFFQYDTEYIYFTPFTCQPLICCKDLEYTVSKTQTQTPVIATQQSTPVLDLNPSSPTFNKMTMQVSTNNIENSFFFIHFQNKYATYTVSSIVSLNIHYNCKFDKIIINPDPIYSNEKVPKQLKFIVENVNTLKPNLHLNLSTGDYNTLEVDLSRRISHNASQYCQLQFQVYRIEDVKNQGILNTQVFKKYVTVEPNGKLVMSKLNNPFTVYLYVSATNGVEWMQQTKPTLLISVIQPYVPPPNFPPSFEKDLPKFYINVAKKGTTTIQLPNVLVLDLSSNKTYFIAIQPLPAFIKINNQEMQITIQLSSLPDSYMKDNQFDLLLCDQLGACTKYNLQIRFYTFQSKKVIDKKVVQDKKIKGIKKTEKKVEIDKMRQNVTGFIESIDVFGLMTIKFNASMFTNFSLNDLNETNVDMYVIPYQKSASMEISAFNLTWKIKEYQSDTMQVQLDFDNPVAISLNIVWDTIVVHVKEEHKAFYSPQVTNYLHEDSLTMRSKIRKQLRLEYKGYMKAASSSSDVSMGVLIFSLVFSSLPSGERFKYFMYYLRSLQLIIHIPMFHIVIPANVCGFFQSIIPVVTFDLIDPEWSTKLVFNFDYEQQRKFQEDLLDQMADLGYQSHNSIIILGSLWLFALVYVVKVVIYVMYVNCVKNTWLKNKLKFIRGWKNQLFFCFILELMIEPYFEWCIAARMNMHHMTSTYFGDRLGNFTGYFSSFIAFTLFPAILMYVDSFPLKEYSNPKFIAKWGVITQDSKNNTRFHSRYIMVLTSRRLLFLCICYNVQNYPGLQIMLLLFMNLGILLYVGTKPLVNRELNYLLFLEEQVIVLVCFHMLVFTEWCSNEETKLQYGWSMIIIICAHFVIVIARILYICFDLLRMYFIKFFLLINRWVVSSKLVLCINTLFKKVFGISTDQSHQQGVQMINLKEYQANHNMTFEIKDISKESDFKEMNIRRNTIGGLPYIIEKFSKYKQQKPHEVSSDKSCTISLDNVKQQSVKTMEIESIMKILDVGIQKYDTIYERQVQPNYSRQQTPNFLEITENKSPVSQFKKRNIDLGTECQTKTHQQQLTRNIDWYKQVSYAQKDEPNNGFSPTWQLTPNVEMSIADPQIQKIDTQNSRFLKQFNQTDTKMYINYRLSSNRTQSCQSIIQSNNQPQNYPKPEEERSVMQCFD